MLGKLLLTLSTLRDERRTRWAGDARHCTVCGRAFGPNDECACD